MPPWLLELDWKAIGGSLGMAALAFWKVVLPQLSAWATRKFIKSDPGPVAPMPLPPAPTLEMVEELRKVAKTMAEWSLDEARRRVRELEDDLIRYQHRIRQLELDLEDVSRDNVATSRALAGANIRIEELTRQAQAADGRAKWATEELRSNKLEATSGHSNTAITPMLPKAR